MRQKTQWVSLPGSRSSVELVLCAFSLATQCTASFPHKHTCNPDPASLEEKQALKETFLLSQSD